MAKRSSFGSMVRKRLSDITNSHHHPKSPNQNEKPVAVLSSRNDIDKLLEENMELMKLLADREKTIECNEVELQKWQIDFQKIQLQNWNLAQLNRQFLAELNSTNEKVKALQHELACMSALLKAKNLELEEKAKLKYQKINNEEITEPSLNKCIDKGSRKPIRRRPARCQSVGFSNTIKKVADKKPVQSNRNFLRRQSRRCSRSKQIGEPNEDYFEINPNLDHQDDCSSVQRVGPAFLNSPSGIEGNIENHVSKSKGREFPERSSIVTTPLNRAVERGPSYKEVSLLRPLRRAVRVTPTRKLPLVKCGRNQSAENQ